MKKLIFILLICVSSVVTAQNPLTFEEVVQTDSLNKNETYQLALIWFTESFTNAKNVIQLKDEETGQIIGRGTFKYNSATFMGNVPVNGYISFAVKIFCKDGRYKYVITDFYHNGTSTSKSNPYTFGLITTDEVCPRKIRGQMSDWHEKQWQKMQQDCTNTATLLIQSMKEKIKKDKLQNDW